MTTTGQAAGQEEEIFLNPFEPGFFDDPYDTYRWLRDDAPVMLPSRASSTDEVVEPPAVFVTEALETRTRVGRGGT